MRDAGDDVNDPLTPLEALFPIGTQHPEPVFAGLFASRYRKLQREDGTTDIWRAEIIYESPLVFNVPNAGAWNVSFSSSLQSEQAVTDINGKRIGGLAYRRETELGPSPPGHVAHTIDGPVRLVPAEGPDGTEALTPAPVNKFKRVASMTLRRNQPATMLTVPQITVALGAAGTVNSDRLVRFGISPRQMLFTGADIALTSGQVNPDTSSLATYDITLDFSINYERWTPILIHDFFDHKGFRSSIILDGGPVTRSFDVQPEQDFSLLFSVFGDLTLFENLPVEP